MLRSDVSDKIRKFNEQASELIEGQTNHSQNFVKFIESCLRQFRLSGMYNANDIFAEAYLRGYYAIVERGVEIVNPAGWFRSVAVNIIREQSRMQLRSVQAISPSFLEDFADRTDTNQLSQLSADEERSANIRKLAEAWESLSLVDREILRMRLIEGASWQSIAQKLSNGSISAYRKRGSRALSKLREMYMTLSNQ